MIAASQDCKLRPVSVEVDGEARTFLLNERGRALALDQDLGIWLGLNRHAYPLRRNIRWYAEQGTLGEVQTVFVMSGRPGRPVSAYCLSRDQLLLLLTVAVIAVRPQAREQTLRGYSLAEGKPAAPEPRPELAGPPPRRPGLSEEIPDVAGLSAEVREPPSIELVPFSGGTLSALRSDGAGWLVLKPACEALGVDARGQQQRLERTPWATACVMHAVGADGKRREMYCLRADRVAMWLATIDTARIADPEARQRLELWQCHAADALDRWARGRDPSAAPQLPPEWRSIVDHTLNRARELFVEKVSPTAAPPRPMDPGQWLSPRQAAARAGVGIRRVYGWLRSAQLEHRRLGPRDLRIHVDALSAFLAAHDRDAGLAPGLP
jgi:hypothetical protein